MPPPPLEEALSVVHFLVKAHRWRMSSSSCVRASPWSLAYIGVVVHLSELMSGLSGCGQSNLHHGKYEEGEQVLVQVMQNVSPNP